MRMFTDGIDDDEYDDDIIKCFYFRVCTVNNLTNSTKLTKLDTHIVTTLNQYYR